MSRKKVSPRPSERCGRGDLHPAPTSFLTSFLEGLLVWSLWLAALSRGDANPTCLSQLDGFMKSVAHDRSVPKLRKLSVGLSASRVGGGALTRWPPSAAQTVRADFRHTAFTKTLMNGSENRA